MIGYRLHPRDGSFCCLYIHLVFCCVEDAFPGKFLIVQDAFQVFNPAVAFGYLFCGV